MKWEAISSTKKRRRTKKWLYDTQGLEILVKKKECLFRWLFIYTCGAGRCSRIVKSLILIFKSCRPSAFKDLSVTTFCSNFPHFTLDRTMLNFVKLKDEFCE